MVQRDERSCPVALPSLLTRPFVLLCLAVTLGYANQWMVMPIIPLYVNSQGGSAFVAGLALLSFSLPSVVVRPFIGILTDRWNPAGVLAVGLLFLAAGSSMLLVPAVVMLVFGSVVRGLGWAGVNTGGYARLAASAPPERRGEAAGYYSAATSAASMVIPALGLWLLHRADSFAVVFLCSIFLALAGLPIAICLARNGSALSKQTPNGGPSGSILDRGVLIATALNLCSTLAMPAVMAFLPLYAQSLDIEHAGLFYVVAGIANILLRPILGRWSDRIGRAPGIAFGLMAQFLGIALIATAQGLSSLLASAFCVAVGMSLTTSITTALAMDLANPSSRGQAMATYSMSYQIGAGLGALLAGALADHFGLRGMYIGSLVITGSGLLLLALIRHRLPIAVKSSPAGDRHSLKTHPPGPGATG